MSATMTGPRHSPSSTWQHDAQNQAFAAAASVRTPSSRLSTPHLDSTSSPNYFSISVNNSQSGLHEPRQGFHATNEKGSGPHAQSSIHGQRPQILPRMSTSESMRAGSVETDSGSGGGNREPVFHGFPWQHPAAAAAAAEKGARNERGSASFPFGSPLPQISIQQMPSQPNLSLKMPPNLGVSSKAHQSAPEVGGHAPLSMHGIQFISPERCYELLTVARNETMVLDVRPYAHYAQGNINGSLNLCIPTTLLKRPSFDTQKLQSTFSDDAGKKGFAKWKQCRYIIVYDAMTANKKDAGPLSNVLKKFLVEGWKGDGMILSGGFAAFNSRFPNSVQRDGQQEEGGQQQQQQQQQPQAARSPPKKPFQMNISLPPSAPVSGGCALPDSDAAVIPFFSNIRQNTDLVGGVGQLSVQLPKQLTESKKRALPHWLQDAATNDQGYGVSQKFLKIEQQELERMRHALSYDANKTTPKEFRIAGIEMGTKNRYNDIYPFEHSRVRLQNTRAVDNDYVNASHLKTEYSNKRYIATQAPVPDTFNDFWRIIWEQDVRLVVTLTSESERGQVKCHPYWESGNYGPLRVNNFSQRSVYMDELNPQQAMDDSRQGQTMSSTEGASKLSRDGDNALSESPCIIVRHFGISHSGYPFQQLREITQLQFPYWPDFGTTSQPSHLLQLIEQCDQVKRATDYIPVSRDEAEPPGQRPVLVHCSAGCGRTGTFCTVDSVLDILKRQRSKRQNPWGNDASNPAGAQIYDDTQDLIAKTLSDFRTQRPSMIQNLSQYVLCYESVLEWAVSEMSNENN